MEELFAFLKKRYDALAPIAKENSIEAWRWYDQQLKGFGFSLEVFVDNLHIHLNKEHCEGTFKEELLQGLQKNFGFQIKKIFVKERKQLKGRDQYNRAASYKPVRFVVRENRSLFWVNLSDYFDTGLFLDHREARKYVGNRSSNKRILNLFAYTGAFSVYAYKGKAKFSVTVDTSKSYLKWAEENFKLNKMSLDKNLLIREDAIQYLKDPKRDREEKFDIIVIDPPTFSNSKGRLGSFDVQKDHVFLIDRAMQLLTDKGFILFSNNFTAFKLDAEKLKGYDYENITEETAAFDFKDSHFIRHCFLFRKKNKDESKG